jgi:pyridoxal phosphate enzyme (YggS family)
LSSVAENLERIRGALLSAVERSGRSADSVALVAVSKTHPPEAVREAFEAGQVLFGESRVQELRMKAPLVSVGVRWHFIGHLQRNKVRQVLGLPVELFHGIDSLALALEMERVSADLGGRPRILLEVNVAGESSKFGFRPDSIRKDMEQILRLQRVSVEGLMAIPPITREAEGARRYFVALRELRDDLEREFGVCLPVLSMGMSSDFEVAVEEGSTLVRVGSALFGERTGSGWRSEPESGRVGQ